MKHRNQKRQKATKQQFIGSAIGYGFVLYCVKGISYLCVAFLYTHFYVVLLSSFYRPKLHSIIKMNFISKSASTIFSRVSSSMTVKHIFPSTTTTTTTNISNVCFMGTKTLFKTNRAAAKRIRVRGSGSIKRYVSLSFKVRRMCFKSISNEFSFHSIIYMLQHTHI
jgi:hypothetical protein